MNVDDGRLGTLADALAPLVEHVKEQKAEIERLRADAKQARQAYDALSAAAAKNYGAKDAEIKRLGADNERLRALLLEARREFDALYDDAEIAKRIDAALGGGAPCATCNGTEWVPAPGNAEFGWLHESRPCPDCDRSALPCDHPEDRRFWNGPTVTCEDCLAMGNVFEGDTLPDRIVQWVTE